jgi:hypothetical protein
MWIITGGQVEFFRVVGMLGMIALFIMAVAGIRKTTRGRGFIYTIRTVAAVVVGLFFWFLTTAALIAAFFRTGSLWALVYGIIGMVFGFLGLFLAEKIGPRGMLN